MSASSVSGSAPGESNPLRGSSSSQESRSPRENRVLREESEHGWWELTSREPHESLRGLVRRYVGYREWSAVPVRRREVPTGDVSLIASFGPRIEVRDEHDPGLVRHRLTSFVVPVDDAWAVTEYTGEQHGVEVTLTPPAAGRLLGVPLHQLAEQVLELEDVLGAEGRLLVERLAGAADWSACFDVLDTVLPDLLMRGREPSPAASWAWRRLWATGGRVPIGALVDELGCSHRYLLSEFRRHVGVRPKTLARVLRCQMAIRLLDAGQSLPEVAVRCGYADQAHLNLDFRRITGLSPDGWRRAGQVPPPWL